MADVGADVIRAARWDRGSVFMEDGGGFLGESSDRNRTCVAVHGSFDWPVSYLLEFFEGC